MRITRYTPEQLQDWRDACLTWCNAKRAERNKEPLVDLPKGRQGDPQSCPCGAATGLQVSALYYYDPEIDQDLLSSDSLPIDVRWFVKAFDDGYYPDLIEAVSNT